MPFAATLRISTAPLRPRKGDVTRAAIVEAALALARRDGLESLTIGVLAGETQMSKSGVFAHFGAREELQRAVLEAYAQSFVADVLQPAVRAPRGLPRLRTVLDRWVAWLAREAGQGCLMMAGAAEYDDRPGPLRDAMVAIVTGWKGELLEAIAQAVEAGHLRTNVDAEQLVFEIYGLMLALHQDARLLRSPDSVARTRVGLTRLLATASVPPMRKPRRMGSTLTSATVISATDKRGTHKTATRTRATRTAATRRRPRSL
jgi:AcrR family transcriptional regulator